MAEAIRLLLALKGKGGESLEGFPVEARDIMDGGITPANG